MTPPKKREPRVKFQEFMQRPVTTPMDKALSAVIFDRIIEVDSDYGIVPQNETGLNYTQYNGHAALLSKEYVDAINQQLAGTPSNQPLNPPPLTNGSLLASAIESTILAIMGKDGREEQQGEKPFDAEFMTRFEKAARDFTRCYQNNRFPSKPVLQSLKAGFEYAKNALYASAISATDFTEVNTNVIANYESIAAEYAETYAYGDQQRLNKLRSEIPPPLLADIDDKNDKNGLGKLLAEYKLKLDDPDLPREEKVTAKVMMEIKITERAKKLAKLNMTPEDMEEAILQVEKMKTYKKNVAGSLVLAGVVIDDLERMLPQRGVA